MSSAAVLTHRYSFDTDARDSVGGSDGTMIGNARVDDGALVLDGTNSCVQLPGDLFTNTQSLSLEIWYADEPVNCSSNELFHFFGPGGGVNYVLSGQETFSASTLFWPSVVALPSPAVGSTHHLILVQQGTAKTNFVDGVLSTFGTYYVTPEMIGVTTTNYLGAGDTNGLNFNFKGKILEFRTYEGTLSPLDAAVLEAFGPDQAQIDPGTLEGVRIVPPTATGPGALIRASVFADFSGVKNVSISSLSDLVLASDNSDVITVATNQRLKTVGVGTANVTAVWGGFSNSVAMTVSVPQDIALLHRYSFNEQTNDWIVHDSVGRAHGQLFNVGKFPPTNGVFTGTGEMMLAGGDTWSESGGYVALPPGLVSCLSEVTIEAWVTWNAGPVWTRVSPPPIIYLYDSWQRVFDFGDSWYNYFFLTAQTDTTVYTSVPILRTAVSTNSNPNEIPRLDWTNALPVGVLSHVAVTYSPSRHTSKMYLNGAPVACGTAVIPLSEILDTHCFLGRSQWDQDPYFYGSFSEFRIYSGFLSDADIAAEYAAGPEVIGADYVLHPYLSNNRITLSWGASATNLVLQSCSTLTSGAEWKAVAISPSAQNGRYTVTVPLTNDVMFYRLGTP